MHILVELFFDIEKFQNYVKFDSVFVIPYMCIVVN